MAPETIESPIESLKSASTNIEEFENYINPDGSKGGIVSLGNEQLGILPAKVGENVFIGEGSQVLGDTTVEDDVFIGENVSVDNKARIGHFALIGANSQLRFGASVEEGSELGEGVWVCRFATVPSGQFIKPGTIVPR